MVINQILCAVKHKLRFRFSIFVVVDADLDVECSNLLVEKHERFFKRIVFLEIGTLDRLRWSEKIEK